jgi:hypothetical protein
VMCLGAEVHVLLGVGGVGGRGEVLDGQMEVVCGVAAGVARLLRWHRMQLVVVAGSAWHAPSVHILCTHAGMC